MGQVLTIYVYQQYMCIKNCKFLSYKNERKKNEFYI